jgi:hypothetical protein
MSQMMSEEVDHDALHEARKAVGFHKRSVHLGSAEATWFESDESTPDATQEALASMGERALDRTLNVSR